jgi:thiol-disulfide isomerase/thioredoxin
LNLLLLRRPSRLLLLVIVGIIVGVACSSASNNVESGQGSLSQPAGDSSQVESSDGTSTTPEPPTPQSTEPAAPAAAVEPNRTVGSSVGQQAPEFVGITNWINSEPLTLEGLRGKVVLLDVWTYTCVNCIRTFPFLKQWHARYADDGLVIVGLHAPEFEFEKETKNVVEAAEEHAIVWPIAQDNNFSTWRAYNNRYWPAKYLIDKDGVVRYIHFGEGAYAETEEIIRELLQEAGADLSDDESSLPTDQARDQAFEEARSSSPQNAEVTPERYAGYERNFSAALGGFDPYVVQTEYYQNRDAVASFQPPEKLKPHKVYFNGDWFIGPENVKHARSTDTFEDYIALKYSAKSVNAVITSESGEPYKVRIIMDGDYLTEENSGQDVTIGEDGESFILVTEPRLYSIVDNFKYQQDRVLELRANSDDFGLFAFTFGVYQEGP